MMGMFVWLACVSAGQADTKMTLEEAVTEGLKHNYNIRIIRNNARIAENNSGQGTAAFLPSVNAQASVGRNEAEVETNSPFSFGDTETENLSAQVGFDWTIFDGFQMFAQRKRFNQLAKLGQAEAKGMIEATVVAISGAFFSAVTEEQLLDVAGQTLEISRTRLEKAQLRHDLGGASSTDLLNAQVSLNADEAAYLNRELRVTVARQTLNLLLGREADQSLIIDPDLPDSPLELTLEELKERALDQNAELMQILARAGVAQSGLSGARSRFLPRIGLNGSYGYSDRTVDRAVGDDVTTTTTETNLGLNLTWNLFNGGRDRIGWQNAKVESDNARLAREEAGKRVIGKLVEEYQRYLSRNELATLEEQNVTAASRNVGLIQDRFESGALTSLEFRDAQVQLVRAQTALIVARQQTRLALLALRQLTGMLRIE